jgi:hypothetical protein
MPSAQTFPGAGQFDPIGSTYRHEIHLKNGKKLIGYSKGKTVNEMADKTVLIQRVILRLLKNGYLYPNRTSRIEFYRNSNLEGEKELLLILEPLNYSFGSNQRFILNERINAFLKKMYMQIKSGNLDYASLKQKPLSISESDLFDISKERFKTEPELLEWILQKKKEGFQDGMVMNYFFKYRQKYFSL